MKRLRQLGYWVLPVVLAALAANALMPVGFMASGGGDSMVAGISVCSQDKDRRESIEIPGPGQPDHATQCKHCFAPILGTPFAFIDFHAPAVTPLLIAPRAEEQVAHVGLLRSQAARAPPRA